MQSLGEALAIRVAFYNDDKETGSGLDGSNSYQRTRTVSLKFKNDGSFNVDAPHVTAFAELDNDGASRYLIQEGDAANSAGKQLIKSVKDGLICDLIAHAKSAGRIVPALAKNPLKLPTYQNNGKSAYGQHPNVIALFGNTELAELSACYLSERCSYKEGVVWDYTSKDSEEALKGREDSALVQAVVLVGVDYDVGDVSANVDFSGSGRARAVVPVGALGK